MVKAHVVAVAWVAGLSVFAVRGDITVSYRNGLNLPASATDQHGTAFIIAGLSGLTSLPDGRFVAVMDNSNKLLFFRPEFASDGALTGVTNVSGLTMSQTRDFEDIALIPGSNSAVLCDEGGSGQLSLVDLATGVVSAGPMMPAVFANVRANFGLESVSITPDGESLWTCNEEALTVDGGVSTSSAGTRVRLQRFTRFDGAPSGFVASAQWCYITQPMHGAAITGARSGVSALVALPDGQLLAMERAFAFNSSSMFLTRMYLVSTAGATETSLLGGLASVVLTPCGKTTRYGGGHANLEGLALGSVVSGAGSGGVPAGRRVMLGIVDDGDPLSTSRLHAFSIDGLAAGCGPADFGGQGGVVEPDGLLNNNDFVAFIDRFFSLDPRADLGRQGGVRPGDGLFNNNDFIVFIDLFFAGC